MPSGGAFFSVVFPAPRFLATTCCVVPSVAFLFLLRWWAFGSDLCLVLFSNECVGLAGV